jgi:hypothetical protein
MMGPDIKKRTAHENQGHDQSHEDEVAVDLFRPGFCPGGEPCLLLPPDRDDRNPFRDDFGLLF